MAKIWGITEMPVGERPSYYPDMITEKLIGHIEAEGGRWAWSRATHCPCAPVNNDTSQPNPNCPLCRGIGTLFFGPESYVPADPVGELSDIQRALLAIDGAAVIRGVTGRFARGMTHEENFYDVIGRWRSGEALITVRPENRIGYMDRLIQLDATIVHSEWINSLEGIQEIPLKYRAVSVNHVISMSQRYTEGTHFSLDTEGRLTWTDAFVPTADTPIAVHYLCHPTWRVMDMPHSNREITRRYPKPRTGPDTPHGQPVELPIAAIIALEMLPIKEG